jgi:translation initiation factor IF-2
MHPTSRGMMGAPGLAPPPVEQQRRPPDKRGGRTQRDRQHEQEEKILRPVRREAPAGPPPVNREITISEGITVKELSEKLDVKASLVIKKLVDRNIFATINQTLDSKLATIWRASSAPRPPPSASKKKPCKTSRRRRKRRTR